MHLHRNFHNKVLVMVTKRDKGVFLVADMRHLPWWTTIEPKYTFYFFIQSFQTIIRRLKAKILQILNEAGSVAINN